MFTGEASRGDKCLQLSDGSFIPTYTSAKFKGRFTSFTIVLTIKGDGKVVISKGVNNLVPKKKIK